MGPVKRWNRTCQRPCNQWAVEFHVSGTGVELRLLEFHVPIRFHPKWNRANNQIIIRYLHTVLIFQDIAE